MFPKAVTPTNDQIMRIEHIAKMDKLRKMLQRMNDTEIKLLTLLNSSHDIIELDWKFDSDTVIEQLKQGTWEEGLTVKTE